MALIIVLEDMESRVEWLARFVGNQSNHNIIWAMDVDQLILDLANNKPDLLILDHDLGGIPRNLEVPTKDATGQDGSDAAECMPKVDCPVLVWSFNSAKAPSMVKTLQQRGMNALWAPFGTDRCVATISSALISAAKDTTSIVPSGDRD